MKLKKLSSFLLFIGFVAGLGILYSFTTNSIENFKETNQPKWENLKVLPQDISKDSLEGLMKEYSISLGVKCSYCHTPREDNPERLDFADDGKMTKEIARGMIKMTEGINENYFKPHYPEPKPDMVTDVSCVMCHRGTAKPNKYLEGIGNIYQKSDEEK